MGPFEPADDRICPLEATSTADGHDVDGHRPRVANHLPAEARQLAPARPRSDARFSVRDRGPGRGDYAAGTEFPNNRPANGPGELAGTTRKPTDYAGHGQSLVAAPFRSRDRGDSE